jgi:hypothetical protein
MTDRIVIFLHLPKAAGSTLKRIIAHLYPQEAIYPVGGKERTALRAEIAEVTRPPSVVRILTGHAPFGLHETAAQPCTYITVLRDPVERLISQYFYVKKLPSHHMHAAVAGGELTLPQFAERLANSQTRSLAGMASADSDAVMLERAKQNLAEHFAAVGLTERFDESIVLFCRALGWRVRGYTRANVAKGRPKAAALSPEDMAAVRAQHTLDAELYDFARTRFDAEIRRQDAGFQRELSRLRFGCRVMDFTQRLRGLLRR